MTKCIYPGSEEIPNLVGFFPSLAQGRHGALGLPARSKVTYIGSHRGSSMHFWSYLPGCRGTWPQVTFLPLEWCRPACVCAVRSCVLFHFTGCEGGKGEFMAGLDRENKP